MNNLIIFTLLTTLIICIFIYKLAFFNGKPHCDGFVTNVYLYLALSISLSGCFIHLYNALLNSSVDVDNYITLNKTYTQIKPYLLISFIVSIVSIIMLSFQPLFSKDGYVLNHILWIIFIASISISLYPYFKSKEFSLVIQKALLMTCLIFIFMSIIVILFPDFFKKSYMQATIGLLIALMVIIITEFILLLTGQYTNDMYSKMSYVVIIIFSLFIAYDTVGLFRYADICVNSPNYPLLSSNLFLDILNIFVRLMGSSSR